MPIVLNETEQQQLKKFEKMNRSLFILGWVQLLVVVGIWVLIGLNMEKVGEFVTHPTSNEKILCEHLNNIVPQSEQEENLLREVKELSIVPRTLVILGGIDSILMMIFILSLVAICFAMHQRKLIRFFKLILKQNDHH